MDGVASLQQGNADVASEKLEKAFDLLQAPSIALWSARALVKRGQWVEASERYQQAGRLAPSGGNQQAIQEQAKKDCARELSELSPRIPKLVIALAGASASDVSLSVDGSAVSSSLIDEERLVNPGPHRVLGVRGPDRVEKQVTALEAQRVRVVLEFQPRVPEVPATKPGVGAGSGAANPAHDHSAPAPEGGRNHTLAYVALGLGGAGLITGSVAGLIALKEHNDFKSNTECDGNQCGPSQRGAVDRFHTIRTVSTIGFVAGGALAATGLVLLLTGGSTSSEGQAGRAHPVSVGFGLDGVRVSGRF
jgi:hypothetical protein